jgi:ferric-dicitrate binding protein FerR (iron transport regulator)
MSAKIAAALTACLAYGQGLTPERDAYVTAAQGRVSVDRDNTEWAVSTGERVRASRMISTGADGYARLELAGGSNFEIFANSRVGFRQNAATAGDLMDLFIGRARVHFHPGPGQTQQRIFCPTAVITAMQPATIAIAMDGNDTVRIDVLEGQVRVQHKLLPRAEPTVLTAVDAILVEPDEQIVRKVDRGTLYRYGIKPLHDLFTLWKHNSPPVVEQELFASR